MPGSVKAMALGTVACLVAVVAYTVALGWLWFGWVVLGLCTAGAAAIRVPR
jgi:hypothetical protein